MTPHDGAAIVEPPPPHEPSAATPLRHALPPGLLAVLGVVVVANSIDLGLWASVGPGPGFFPIVLGALLAALSLIWLVSELRPGQRGDVAVQGPDEEPVRPRQVAVIVVSLIALATLMPVIGFQLSMLLFLGFHLRVVGRRRWLLTAVIATTGSFGVFTLFDRVLTVNLPAAGIDALNALGF